MGDPLQAKRAQFRIRVNGSGRAMFCHGGGSRPTAEVEHHPNCTLHIAPRSEYVQRQVHGIRTDHCAACGRAFFSEFLDLPPTS
jgi:hypothetical protein